MFGFYSRWFPSDPLNLKRSPRVQRLYANLRRVIKRSPVGPTSKTADERERYTSRSRFIFTDLICAALPESERFTILDGGALQVAEETRWRGYDRTRLRFYGFEIDEAECHRLNRQAPTTGIEACYFPIGLWSGPGRRSFYVTQSAGGSSLFPVNSGLIDRWKMQNPQIILLPREAMRVEHVYEVPVDSLNNIARKESLPPIDFMKLNIQGAELEALRGATDVLPTVLGLQVELSFVESYIGRPYFADVDPFLRKQGFSFLDLIGLHYLGREKSPVTVRHLPGVADLCGQLIEAHGVYFRDPIDLQMKGDELTWANKDSLLKLVSLAEVYHQIEFAIEVADWTSGYLARRGDQSGADEVRQICQTGVEKYVRFMS